MITRGAITLGKWLLIIVVVIFVATHLIADPVGSAEFVSTIVGWIVHAIQSIFTFATNVHT